jgi:hypothetical protein
MGKGAVFESTKEKIVDGRATIVSVKVMAGTVGNRMRFTRLCICPIAIAR